VLANSRKPQLSAFSGARSAFATWSAGPRNDDASHCWFAHGSAAGSSAGSSNHLLYGVGSHPGTASFSSALRSLLKRRWAALPSSPPGPSVSTASAACNCNKCSFRRQLGLCDNAKRAASGCCAALSLLPLLGCWVDGSLAVRRLIGRLSRFQEPLACTAR
jgi:hypothetical protein